MAAAKVSVSSALKVTPDTVELDAELNEHPKRKNKVHWEFEGQPGDVFVVVIEGAGCFRDSGGTYTCRVRGGSGKASIRTAVLKTKKNPVPAGWKYSVLRVRDGKTSSVDPRIKIIDT